MEVADTMLVDVAYLANLYLVWGYRFDILKANAQAGEFHTMDQQLDKHNLTAICLGGLYVLVAVDKQHVYGLYNGKSIITIISLGLTKALEV